MRDPAIEQSLICRELFDSCHDEEVAEWEDNYENSWKDCGFGCGHGFGIRADRMRWQRFVERGVKCGVERGFECGFERCFECGLERGKLGGIVWRVRTWQDLG